MPKINRIRVANVVYDNKHITDEMYDSFGGENILLNLANGSGKSVLVQMMLQPILPCAKIHGRRIEDYLSTTSSPTCICIEWKLDNTLHSTYLLTGIVLCVSGSNDESTSRVKYFTFTNYYTAANGFDISHLPFIEHKENGVIYHSYDTALKEIKQIRDSSAKINHYVRDEMDRYKKDLAEYGILQNEWKIIQSINEKEGGVDELFASCRTSDSIIDKWILKTVSENLSHGGEDLFEMFVALMDSILEQEDDMRQMELLVAFQAKVSDYINTLHRLCDSLSAGEKIEQTLVGLYDYFTDKKSELEDQQEKLSSRDTELQDQLQIIQYEELSESLYQKFDAWEKACELAEDAAVVLQEKEQVLQSAKKSKEIQGAAQQYGILSEARDRINALQEQRKRLETSDASEETINLEYSLRIRYGEEMESSLEHIKRADEIIARLKSQRNEIAESLRETRKESEHCVRKSGLIQEKIDAFLKYESTVFQELGLYVRRMLMGNLDPSEIEEAKSGLLTAQMHLQDKRLELEQKSEMNSKRLNANIPEQANCEQSRRDTSIRLENIKREIQNYLNEEDKLKMALSQCRIPFENRFEKDMNTITLNEQRRLLADRQYKISVALNQQREFLRSFRNGSVHTDPAFAEILSNAGIEFTTGDKYLTGCENSVQERLIAQNPLLPYCFLIAKKDMARVTKLPATEEIGCTCPIIAFEDLERSLPSSNQIINLSPHSFNDTLFGESSNLNEQDYASLSPLIQFACYFNKRSFAADTKDSYEEMLQKEIATIEEEERHCRLELQELTRNSDIILQFPYEQGTFDRLTKEQSDLNQEIARLEQESKILMAEAAELRHESITLLQHLSETEKSLERIRSKLQRFDEYLNQNDLYLDTQKKKRENEAHLQSLEKQIVEQEQQLEVIRESLLDQSNILKKLKDAEDKYRHSINKLPIREAGILLPGSLTVLEEQYQYLLTKASNDSALLQEKIKQASKEEDSASKILRKNYSHLDEQEYISVSYDEDLYDRLCEKCDIAQAEFDAARKSSIEAEAARNTELSLYSDRINALKSSGYQEPLPRDEIKGNYSVRRESISQSRSSIKTQQDQNQKQINQYERFRNDIRRTVNVDGITRVVISPSPNWEELSINDLNRQLAESKKTCTQISRETEATYLQLKQEFVHKHHIIDSFLGVASPENKNLVFNEFYYVYERTVESNDRISDCLKVIENALEMIEKDKNHIVQHAVLQGKKLYSEMKRISGSSFVKLPEKKTPQQMLRIELPEDLDGAVEDRMKDHINQCIHVLRRERDEATESASIRKKVASMLSDRQLLNITINKSTLSVKLYKVDINPNNSRLKPWENVVIENSGGEMFVSCFILISALIAYTRGKVMEQHGEDRPQGTKTFIIDNPFGKTSSRHLLEAMIEIANKFNTQMICLSDLSQSSITGQFALIYQLSVRPSLYGSKSYLKTDDVIETAPVTKNDRLEHIYFKSDQISMF